MITTLNENVYSTFSTSFVRAHGINRIIKKASDCRAATQPLRAPRDNQKTRHKIVAKLDLPHNDDSLPTAAFPSTASRVSSRLSRYRWVNYFAVGHSGECFCYVKDWIEKKVRRHLAHAQKRKGFGWKRWNRSWLYNTLKLFNGYRVRRFGPKAVPA
jgi:hypothetical protein